MKVSTFWQNIQPLLFEIQLYEIGSLVIMVITITITITTIIQIIIIITITIITTIIETITAQDHVQGITKNTLFHHVTVQDHGHIVQDTIPLIFNQVSTNQIWNFSNQDHMCNCQQNNT